MPAKTAKKTKPTKSTNAVRKKAKAPGTALDRRLIALEKANKKITALVSGMEADIQKLRNAYNTTKSRLVKIVAMQNNIITGICNTVADSGAFPKPPGMRSEQKDSIARVIDEGRKSVRYQVGNPR